MSKQTPKPEAIEPEAVEPEVDVEIVEPTDSPLAAAPTVSTASSANTYTAVDGDTYSRIADLHPTKGKSKHERATELFALNMGKAITAGTIIKL